MTEELPEDPDEPEKQLPVKADDAQLVEPKPAEPPGPAPEPTEVTKVIIRTRAAAPWAVAAVLITGILVVGFLVYSVAYRLPHEAATVAVETVGTTVERVSAIPTGIATAFKPNVNVNTVIHRAIDELQDESKLVIMTANVDVEIMKTSEKRILWDLLQLGDTTVRMRVPGNKVQYYIPVAGLSRDNFEFDPASSTVCLHLPEPVLDREFVDVQTNPDRITIETEVGWGRLQAYSGEFLEEEARRALRETVLQEGARQLLTEKAKVEAEKVVTAMLMDLTAGLRDDVVFRVKFHSQEEPAGGTTNG